MRNRLIEKALVNSNLSENEVAQIMKWIKSYDSIVKLLGDAEHGLAELEDLTGDYTYLEVRNRIFRFLNTLKEV